MYYNSTNKEFERIDKKAERIRDLMTDASQSQVTSLWRQLDISTIYHDWGLEGQVVLPDELDGAFNNRPVTDATALPLYTALRAHRKAIELSREIAQRKQFSFSVELFREFHALFSTDPESAKTGRYRKEIPLHRSYYHEIAQPNKIASSMRKLISWLNDPEEALSLHPIYWVTKFHFLFMRIFPYVETSGKIARTVFNMVLIRHGYLPAIIHATERQRYYEAIRQSQEELVELTTESALASLEAAEKFLLRAKMAS